MAWAFVSHLHAQVTVYWDTNAATSGASGGTTAAGTWDQNTTSNWTTDSTGASTTATWQTRSGGSGIATFAAGTNATGSYTVTTSGTITGIRGITFEEGTVTLSSGGTLTFGANSTINTNANNATINAVLTDGASTFSITKTGTGTLTLGGANTYGGTTSIGTAGGTDAGTIALGASNVLPGTTVNIFAGTLSLGANSDTVGAVNVGGGAAGTTASITGSGTLTLGGNLTYDATNNPNGALISSTINLGAASRVFTVGDSTAAVADLTISGLIMDGTSRALTKAGAGTLVLSNANTYGGATTINAGTLSVSTLANGGAASGIGNSSNAAANLVVNGGTLQYTGAAASSNRRFTLGTSGGTIDASGTGALNLTNTNAVTLSGTNTARTFTLTGTNTDANTLAASLANNGSGATSLTKSDTGTWVLGNAGSSYTGATTINGGILSVGNLANGGANSAIGASTNAAANLVLNGGTLKYTGAGASSNRLFTVGASGGTIDASGTGALTLSNTGNLVASGTGNRTLALTGTSTGTNILYSVIANPSSGTTSVTKTGAGTWILAGNSSYTGTTTVSAGILAAYLNANALGTGAAVVDLAGGTLALANDTALNFARNTTVTANSTISSERASLGAGLTHTLGTLSIGGQTLNVTSGANVNSGTAGVTFGATNVTGNATFNITNGGSNSTLLTLGALNDGGAARTITKSGTGALTLDSGATSLVDGTAVNLTGGTLNSNNATALGTLANVTVSSGATLNVGASQTVGALNGSAGSVTLGANTLTVGSTNNLTGSFGGAISGTGGITKAGTGTATLSGLNTYSGATTVNQGTLVASGSSALGAATGAVTVNAGTLSLDATTITKSTTLSLTGSGTSGSVGALHSGGASGTTSQWKGNISLAGNTTISAAGNLLILGNGLTFPDTMSVGANTVTFHTPSAPTVTPVYEPFPAYLLDPSNIVVNTKLTGTGSIVKTGPGTISIIAGASGGNTLTGDAFITGGKLLVDGYNNVPALNSANVYIGNAGASPGTADSVVLQLGQLVNGTGPQNAIGTWNPATNASATNLTIYSDGVFKMNNAPNGFANLTLQGGHVDGGNIANNTLLTLTGGVTTNASSRTALIDNGNLSISAPNNFTFTVASGTTGTGVDLKIDSIIVNAGGYTGGPSGTSFVKAGAGKMVLNNANTYSGVTNISAGVLNVQHSSALGQGAASFGDTNNGTVVQNGAQLQLQTGSFGSVAIGRFETLTLNGSGISSDGALRNVGGSNTYNGMVLLGSDSRINADSGTTLTIANTNGVNSPIIDGTASGRNLTVGGAGDTVVSGGIGTFVSNIAKDGAGTLTLAGSNSYAGATNVTAGAVKVTHSSGLSGTGVVVSNGAALQFAQDAGSNNISVGATGSTISGTGLSSGGAIQNLTGSNSYAGLVTLAADSLIAANTGTSLTLSGGITSSNKNLTVGTASNNGNITVSGNLSNGTGTLTKAGSGTLTFSGAAGTVGTTALNAGAISVGGSSVLNTGAFSSVAGTTLTIASGGSVAANYSGGTTYFSGAMAGAGEFQKTGAGTLVFNTTFTASSLTLTLNGGTLSLLGGQFTFGTIHITGNTILDFNNSAGTFLSSANLVIDAGVTVTVNNWTSVANNAALSTVWYATSTLNAGSLGGVDQVGGTPLSQVVFTNYGGLTTTWVSGNHGGWFDHEIRPTPEPSTYGAILLTGCLGLIGWRRFRARKLDSV